MKKIVLGLLILLLSTSSAFSQDDQLYRIHINSFSAGMNSYDLPNIIEANQGQLVQNVALSRRGRLSKRKGVDLFAQDLGSENFTGIGRFTPSSTNDFLMVASDGIVHRSTTAASWVTINPASPLSTTADIEFIQADKLLIILDGTNYPPYYDGTTYTESDETSASPPITKCGAWFKNYLFLANGSVEHDWVWFSNNLAPVQFTVGDVFPVNTGDGQQIQWLKPFKLNELIIYKERSIWVLDITGATPLVDWTLQPIIEDIGLIAPRTVVQISNDHWFLSSEPIGVRSLIRTDFDKIKASLISTPIQDIFDGTGDLTINRTYIHQASATFFDNKFLLSIPTGTSLINNTVVVFDLITNAWYLITGWYVEDWQIFDNKLYFIDSSDGRVLRAFYSNNDIASGPVVTTGIQDASPITVGVEMRWESKAFDFESPELYKLPDALDVVAESSGDYDFEVFTNVDGEGWVSAGTMNLAADSPNLPINLPFLLETEGQARKTFQIQSIGEFKEISYAFESTASDELVEIRSFTPIAKKRAYRRE